ncbi:MAG: glutamine-hydrolyzing carbamoyl-phosphate synthase small subunit [Gammaproteobacteria bacterium]
MDQVTAVLALADGTVFQGTSVGCDGEKLGEIVFNTALTGYQEILTDPSYAEQIVTLTYPHIGNVGCNDEDVEADRLWARGLVLRDVPRRHSNWRQTCSLPDYLRAKRVVAIAGVDTRALTRRLRETGAQGACLMARQKGGIDREAAVAAARGFPGLKGMDLANEVTTAERYEWLEGSWVLGEGHRRADVRDLALHVVAMDFGVKRNILRLLVDVGCRVTVVPARSSADDILNLKPDGVFLSNGPGDPEPCVDAIKTIETLLQKRVPLFGICLGHQLLALASGARTEKMKFGHHGANHPVRCHESGRVWITSQNHGFAVSPDELPSHLQVTHTSLFDQSIQGIRRLDVPAFGFQGHPEASPGPHDPQPLFEHFAQLMRAPR